MKREVGLGSHSLSLSSPVPTVSHIVSVDVKHNERRKKTIFGAKVPLNPVHIQGKRKRTFCSSLS